MGRPGAPRSLPRAKQLGALAAFDTNLVYLHSLASLLERCKATEAALERGTAPEVWDVIVIGAGVSIKSSRPFVLSY